MSETMPSSLGRYTLKDELGRGGFATIYRAIDTILEREVALKVLKPGWTDDAKAVERFMREAKQASRLKHPNIVTIFDVGQAEGRLYIAMELVTGRSLQQIIVEEGAQAWSRVLTIMEQGAAALDYAHDQGLIHRDIKPANIILDESGSRSTVRAILTDFGLVRGAEQASLSMGTTGGLIGTPEYIAPEIWDGKPATRSSDIYALGCVAFYLLTGQVLFSATTPMAVLMRHLDGPVFPAQWPAGVPASVDKALRRALAKEAGERPASAAEFVRELRGIEKISTLEQKVESTGLERPAAEIERKRLEAERQAKEETGRRAPGTVQINEDETHRQELAAEIMRKRLEAERQAKEETGRRAPGAVQINEAETQRQELAAVAIAQQKAREEQEQLRQAELAAQVVTEKAKRESEEAERQKQLAQAAALETARRQAAEREQQLQYNAARQAQYGDTGAARPDVSSTVAAGQSNWKRWLYAVGILIAGVAVVGIMIVIFIKGHQLDLQSTQEIPTTTPLIAPSTTPVVPPSTTPVIPPSTTPVVPPSTTPVVPPTTTPEILPTDTPVILPTDTPVILPTRVPPTPAPPISSPRITGVNKNFVSSHTIDVNVSYGGLNLGIQYMIVAFSADYCPSTLSNVCQGWASYPIHSTNSSLFLPASSNGSLHLSVDLDNTFCRVITPAPSSTSHVTFQLLDRQGRVLHSAVYFIANSWCN